MGYTEEIVAQGSGSFLEQIKYVDSSEPFWTINDDLDRLEWVPIQPGMILPSDSTLREDAEHIRGGQWEEAESAKHALEEI